MSDGWVPVTFEVPWRDNLAHRPTVALAARFDDSGQPTELLVEYDRYISSVYGGSVHQRAIAVMKVADVYPGNIPDELRNRT